LLALALAASLAETRRTGASAMRACLAASLADRRRGRGASTVVAGDGWRRGVES
jgi:hypothetical protein